VAVTFAPFAKAITSFAQFSLLCGWYKTDPDARMATNIKFISTPSAQAAIHILRSMGRMLACHDLRHVDGTPIFAPALDPSLDDSADPYRAVRHSLRPIKGWLVCAQYWHNAGYEGRYR
jgi:hypothetical protein